MDIAIGIKHIARELSLETDQPVEEISMAVDDALTNGTTLKLTDHKGRTIIVPADALGYVSMGPDEPRRVGFGIH